MSEIDETTTYELIEGEGFRGGLEGAVESLHEDIKSGGNGAELVATTIESLQEAVIDEVRPIAELGTLLGELSTELGGEYGEALGRVFEKAAGILENAMEWVKENPEVCEAVCRAALLIYIGASDPELLGQLLKTQPELMDFSALSGASEGVLEGELE